MLPKDPVILLSYVNTRLRDGCTSLEEFCLEEDADPVMLTERLAEIGCHYDEQNHQFR